MPELLPRNYDTDNDEDSEDDLDERNTQDIIFEDRKSWNRVWNIYAQQPFFKGGQTEVFS